MPTILGLTPAPDPTGLAGRNLAPHLLAGSSPPDDRFALGSYRMRGYDRFMVRSTRYKLIHDAKEGKTDEHTSRETGQRRHPRLGGRASLLWCVGGGISVAGVLRARPARSAPE